MRAVSISSRIRRSGLGSAGLPRSPATCRSTPEPPYEPRDVVDCARDHTCPLRAQPDRLAPPRQCADGGREPAFRRRARGSLRPSHRRHGSRTDRRGRGGRDPRRPHLARRGPRRGAAAAERARGPLRRRRRARARRGSGEARRGRSGSPDRRWARPCSVPTARRRTSSHPWSTISISASRTSSVGTTTDRTFPCRRGSRARSEHTFPWSSTTGSILGEDGKKLSKRHGHSSIADLREEGFPAAAVRAYLDELGLPEHDVQPRPVPARPARGGRDRGDVGRGARDGRGRAGRGRSGAARRPLARRGARVRAARLAASSTSSSDQTPGPRSSVSPSCGHPPPTDLSHDEARALVRELKAVGGDLRTLRLALTGAAKGPELAAVLAAVPREEALARAGQRERRLTTIARCASTTRYTRGLVDLPAPPGPIRIYSCGPTVYQRIHVGNARPFVVAIWLARLARARRGTGRSSSINITDVNDKIYDAAPGRERRSSPRDATRLVRRGHRPSRARSAGRRADRRRRRSPRPVAHDRGADRSADYAYAAEGDVYFRVARFPTTAVSADSGSTRSRSRSRTRARRIRATSRSGRRTSPARTRRGTRRGVAADRAGTSSARPWPRSTLGPEFGSTAAASTSSSRITRTRSRSRAPLGHPFAQIWMHNGMLELRRRRDAQVAGQRRLAAQRARHAGDARRCSSSS